MKQIFDWMREQISKESWLCKPKTNGHYSDDAVFVEDAMKVINEAEAKWEAECKRADFGWRINEVLPMLEEKCLYGTASLIKAMSDALAIKISEVE